MMIDFLKLILSFSAFTILWAMIGYPLSLLLFNRILKPDPNKKKYNVMPSVTVMIVAHNEEKIIEQKLNNVIRLNYPKEKLQILVASDNSDDNTNFIVQSFINDHPDDCIKLYTAKKRMGKTNAQNEAQKMVDSDILVMTDANAILKEDAVIELVSSFTDENIAYVTGCLQYTNSDESNTSDAESSYWDLDTKVREIESRFQTITAGNGALYAVRNSDYRDFNPIESHDSSMPIFYALNEKQAIANHDAIAYEKAGEVIDDEFLRKVRMNRLILSHILPSFKILNIFKYRWFSYFYFGHRTTRYLLWLAHILLLSVSIILFNKSMLYKMIFVLQLLFYLCAFVQHLYNFNNKILIMIYYYTTTIVAQCVGVFNILTGKAKPFWEKAETTR